MLALSLDAEIMAFEANYYLFQSAVEALPGDATHTDDKRLPVYASGAELFNSMYPDDLGVTAWRDTKPEELVELFGVPFY